MIGAGNEFRGKRIGHGEGALWKNGNWKLVTNLYKAELGRVLSAYRGAYGRLRPRGRWPSTPASRLWWSATNRRFSVIAIIWRPVTPEHWMFLRHTALASVTSVTYDNETGRVMSITYVDPAANVK